MAILSTYFMAIRDIFPILVYCTKKNLATLISPEMGWAVIHMWFKNS
jgi:hypothetical protein